MGDGTPGGAPPLFVSSQAAEAVFSWRDAIEALRAAYAASTPPTALPPRTVGSDDGAWLRTLPALPPGIRSIARASAGWCRAVAILGLSTEKPQQT